MRKVGEGGSRRLGRFRVAVALRFDLRNLAQDRRGRGAQGRDALRRAAMREKAVDQQILLGVAAHAGHWIVFDAVDDRPDRLFRHRVRDSHAGVPRSVGLRIKAVDRRLRRRAGCGERRSQPGERTRGRVVAHGGFKRNAAPGFQTNLIKSRGFRFRVVRKSRYPRAVRVSHIPPPPYGEASERSEAWNLCRSEPAI